MYHQNLKFIRINSRASNYEFIHESYFLKNNTCTFYQTTFTQQVNISRCHYLIDLDTQTDTKFEPNYSTNAEEWTVLYSVPFLEASR